MKYDMILAGVGGQGVLSIAAIIGVAAVDGGLYIKQSEVHGMSQRGGAVQSHLRIADRPSHSDLIPDGAADISSWNPWRPCVVSRLSPRMV
jgi:indolepyruvate ferredoxin oxidoreductase beta subunit